MVHMTTLEINSWNSFAGAVQNLLENYWSNDYCNVVESILNSYRDIVAIMSIKIHFMYTHLDKFPENCGTIVLSKFGVSTKLSRWWRKGTNGDGIKGWWLTTAGIFDEKHMDTINQGTPENGSLLRKCRGQLNFNFVHLLSIAQYFLFFLFSLSTLSNFYAK